MVCGNCSKNKFLIPNQSSKPVRVCNGCYEKLGKSRTSLRENSIINSETPIKTLGKTVDTNVKTTTQVNESSESEDEEESRVKCTEDDLTRSLEDLTIDEKVSKSREINFHIKICLNFSRHSMVQSFLVKKKTSEQTTDSALTLCSKITYCETWGVP